MRPPRTARDKTCHGHGPHQGHKDQPAHDGPRIIYGEGSRLGKARLKREGIVFKQIPYGIKVS